MVGSDNKDVTLPPEAVLALGLPTDQEYDRYADPRVLAGIMD